MLSLALAAILSTSPRAHPDASVVIHIPRLDGIADLTGWMKSAGTRAAALRPESWRNEFHPLLWLDATSAESLSSAGIEPSGPATLSVAGNVRMSCTGLEDPKLFEERAGQRLSGLGQAWRSKGAGGVSLVGARVLDKVIAGYALKGKAACAVSAQGASVEPALAQAAKVLLKPSSGPVWRSAASLEGAALLVTPYGATGLRGSGAVLTAEGRTAKLPMASLKGAGPSPYGGAAPSGLAFVRARVNPAEAETLVRTVQGQLARVCGACDPKELRAVAEALPRFLTGHVLLRVDSVKVRESLRTEAARFFAVRHAFLAEVRQPEALEQALARVGGWGVATPSGGGFALKVKGGEVLLGVRGNHLYLGNDPGAVEAALGALSGGPGKLAHGADFVIDPRLVARGLAQVSLLDVIASAELAALFAAGTELGPLLSTSERIWGFADSAGDGTYRYQVSWEIKTGG